MRTARWYFIPSPLLVVLMLLPALLWAQDSTDKLGIFGPVLDKLWPVIVTFLTSLTVKGVSAANDAFAKTSPYVKYIALYFFALAYNKAAGWLGLTALDPLAPVLMLSMVQTAAAALVFRFGQHATPVVEVPAAAARRI